MSKNYRLETLALHAGAVIDETNARAVPLHRTSSYVFNSTQHASNLFALKELGNIYTRLMNPTQDVLEKRMAALEGGVAALAVASGTSAIYYSIINICGQGDEIVSANNLYGGTYTMFCDILPNFGIKTNFVDINNNVCVERVNQGKQVNPPRPIVKEEGKQGGKPGGCLPIDCVNASKIPDTAQKQLIKDLTTFKNANYRMTGIVDAEQFTYEFCKLYDKVWKSKASIVLDHVKKLNERSWKK